MKRSTFLVVAAVVALCGSAPGQIAPAARPLPLREPMADKNFYLLTSLAGRPDLRAAVESDPKLREIAKARAAVLRQATSMCRLEIECIAKAFRWEESRVDAAKALSTLYASSKPLRAWVDGDLRAAGVYVRYHALPGGELLAKAWLDSAAGIDHAIDVYGLGKPGRTPAIDSMLYDPKSDTWKRLVEGEAALISEDTDRLFFESSMKFALEMMILNHRDEAGRHEPLDKGDNTAAIARIGKTDWTRYAYSVIVVPGSGSDRPGVQLAPFGKLRDEIAAARFRQGKAPFILVSGGYVHPSQTEYAEAIEMKRDLVTRLGVPADAVIVDPHARHTTTNMRNAARLMYRYGIPFDRKALVSSDAGQSGYIEGETFRARCVTELGYLPQQVLARTSAFDLEFVPKIESLQIDPADPLDP